MVNREQAINLLVNCFMYDRETIENYEFERLLEMLEYEREACEEGGDDESEKIGIENIVFNKEAFCEHCGDLEPYTATSDDVCYCLECLDYNDELNLTEREMSSVQLKETRLMRNYYFERMVTLDIRINELSKEIESIEGWLDE